MTVLSCLIIEDQRPAQRILKSYVSKLDTVELIETFGSAIDARAFLESQSADLIFLDLHLPRMDGFAFLRSLAQPPAVIVTTAYSEHAVEAFEFDVTDYLLKPFSFERFRLAVEKASRTSSALADLNEVIFVKDGSSHIRLIVSEIIFISSDGNYLRIVTEQGEHYLLGTLQNWTERLPADRFAQVHRSHIVNVEGIAHLDRSEVVTKAGSLPVGRSFRSELFNRVGRSGSK